MNAPSQERRLRGGGTANRARSPGCAQSSGTAAPAGRLAVGRSAMITVIPTIVARAHEANS